MKNITEKKVLLDKFVLQKIISFKYKKELDTTTVIEEYRVIVEESLLKIKFIENAVIRRINDINNIIENLKSRNNLINGSNDLNLGLIIDQCIVAK